MVKYLSKILFVFFAIFVIGCGRKLSFEEQYKMQREKENQRMVEKMMRPSEMDEEDFEDDEPYTRQTNAYQRERKKIGFTEEENAF